MGPTEDTAPFQHVDSTARIAVYDDMLSSPRIIDIGPNTPREYINEIATNVYSSAKDLGGSIPFSIILQVAENFIHSYFTEVVVTILDDGNTIRFSDQGPGIADKEKAKTPGYSSATADMKRIIHGVGSGLPIVSEYMETMHGHIDIDDNMDQGAVVTISLRDDRDSIVPGPPSEKGHGASMGTRPQPGSGSVTSQERMMMSMVSERGMRILELFELDDVWGVTEISNHLGLAGSTTFNELKKLEEAGMITKLGKKRVLTEMGSRLLNA